MSWSPLIFRLNIIPGTELSTRGPFPLLSPHAGLHWSVPPMVQAAFILSFPSSCWITSFIHLCYVLAKSEFTGELPAVPIGSWNILSWRDPQESSSLTSDPAVHCKGAAVQAPTCFLPTALPRMGSSLWR